MRIDLDSEFNDLKQFMLDALAELKIGQNQDYVFGPVLKMPQAMKYLNMHRGGIVDLVDEGKLPFDFTGGVYRFLKEDLDQYLKETFKKKIIC